MSIFLVGGGLDTVTTANLLQSFRSEAEVHARAQLRHPRLAIVLVDHQGSAEYFLPSYVEALVPDGWAAVEPVFLQGKAIDPAVFLSVDGIVVAGGPTPDYLAGLYDSGAAIRSAVSAGVPYVGFSAGAMIASTAALVGGHRLHGKEVSPREWSEGLDELTVRPGLGLIEFGVDVHTAQAGTLGRTVALVESGCVSSAVGIDEDTCLIAAVAQTRADDCSITGSGNVWSIIPSGEPGSALIVRSASAAEAPQS
ncbi:Type 1 glutamine amidotransferase-like domain-containing protein [Nonomuraea sp. NPDC049784]|uniref:Type 1 glutamine amidotransferase-like domain-containing protein n=1 Tax=Nonomuraea sp. NPDC049784 TaxID=3154361 RepID=UPI003400CB16